MIPPRKVPSRDEYYMGSAFYTSRKSKDPRTQVGACIISQDNEPISSGYNGPPADIDDSVIDWDRPQKYDFIHHAEDNAMWFGRTKCMKNAVLYVTGPPCRKCMLDIVRSGIKRVVFFRIQADSGSMLASQDEWDATSKIAQLGNVKLEEFTGDLSWLENDIGFLKEKGVFRPYEAKTISCCLG